MSPRSPEPPAPPGAPDPRRAGLGVNLGLAAATLLTGRAGLLLAIPPGFATAIWPPAGLALAGLLVFGPRALPGVFAGSLLVNLSIALAPHAPSASPHPWVTALAIAAGATLQGLTGAWLVRRSIGFPNALATGREVGLFLLLGGPVACLVNATWSSLALWVTGALAREALPFTGWTWWVGDVLGVITLAPLVLTGLAEPRGVWRRRRRTFAVPLSLTLVLTVAFFVQASAWERERIRRDHLQRSEAAGILLAAHVQRHLEVLRSIRDFRGASPRFGPKEFGAFVAGALERHPGILALAWNPRILDTQREAFEAARREEGRPGFTLQEWAGDRLVPSGRRNDYFPVLFIEPFGPNESAFGFDVASDPSRGAAMSAAVATGEPCATGPLRLVQDTSGEPGFLVFLPVFQAGQPRGNPQERQDHLEGFLTAAVRVSNLVETALQDLLRDELEVSLHDEASPGKGGLLYANGPLGRAPEGAAWDRSLAVAGRRWRLRVSPTEGYLVRHRSWQAWTVLAGGLLFAGLLGAFLLLSTGRTREGGVGL